MKYNEEKCHISLSTNEKVIVNIGKRQVQSGSCKRPLAIKVHSKPNFKDHMEIICKKPVSN